MLTQAEQQAWEQRDREGAAIVNAKYNSGLLTDAGIVAYLMRHGNSRVLSSRYGTDTETCAHFVARICGPWLEVCDGDAASALESLMSAAVNDSDELAEYDN